MKRSISLQLLPFRWAITFYFRHFLIILGLCLIAGSGRIIQFQAFGTISPLFYWVLEAVVEISRVLILIFIVGMGNIKCGIDAFRKLFTHGLNGWKVKGKKLMRNFKSNWRLIGLNLIVFSAITFLFNFLLGKSAACVVWAEGFAGLNPFQSGSATTQFIFFVKNLTVIPFTLVFEFGLLAFLLDKLRYPATPCV